MSNYFEFETDVITGEKATAEITKDNQVVIEYTKDGEPSWRQIFSGFPSRQEAEAFVLFGDFEDVEEFRRTTGAKYPLSVEVDHDQ